MHHRARGERGQAIVLVALASVLIFGMVAIGVDQSLAMAERRGLQAAADTAAIAGTRQYGLGGSVNAAHRVAMEYLVASLGFAMPSGCVSAASCAGPTFTAGAWSVSLLEPSSGGLDVQLTHNRPAELAGSIGVIARNVARGARASYSQSIGASYAVMALGGAFQMNGGGTNSPTGDVSGPIYADSNIAGTNNFPHAIVIPTLTTSYTGATCSPAMTNHIDTIALDTANYTGPGGASFGGTVNVVVPMTDPFVGIPAPVPSPNPVYTDPNLALGAGNIWQPGTYEGFYPQFMVGVKKTLVATSMAPGIYVIHNVSATMLVGTNAILGSPQHGGTDPTGAVAIVLDSSDTGTLDISQADINGMDDNGTGLRDPLGTHNFVVYGPTYTGAVSLGSGGSSTAYVTGIVDLPLAGAATLSGNPSFHFSGEDVFKSVDVKGAGNGTQTFSSVCNLRAVSGSTGGGLVR